MRIVHFINSLGTGGAERLVVDLARVGVAQGHDVRIVILSSVSGIPLTDARMFDLDVHSLERARFDPRIPWDLRRAVKGFDVVHVHLFPAMYWAASLPIPLIFTEHSTVNRRMNNVLWAIAERRVYGRFDAVVAISEGVRNALQRHLQRVGATRLVSVVPNGIRQEFFLRKVKQPHQGGAVFRFVGVGSLSPVKNWALAIAAVKRVPWATLDIAGDGVLRDQLSKLIYDSGAGDRIRLLGPIRDVSCLLHDYDGMLVTSSWEGFSLAAAEGLAMGIPVVGPDVPGLAEVVTHGVDGLLFSEYSADAVVDSIRKFADTAWLATASESARSGSGRFSIQACFQGYMDVYSKAAAWREG